MPFAPSILAAVRRAAQDVEALLVPQACLSCGAPLCAADSRSACCAGCRNAMQRIAPPKCRRCGQTLDTWEAGRPTDGQTDGHAERSRPSGCGFCHWWPGALSWARSAVWLDDGPARELVHALKYEGWRCAAGPMAELVVRECGERLSGIEALVPIPLGRGRRRERGHNQAETLARAVSQVCGVRVALDAVARTRDTKSQTALAPSERRANVAGAFIARGRLEGLRVALVDDVLTTGATVAAAAEALAAAGAVVGAVTFGRAAKPS